MSIIGITGASGYFGQHITAQLEDDPDCERVVGIDIKEPSRSFKKLDYHRLDVRDPGLCDLFKRQKVDTLIHLAFVLNPIHNAREMHDIDVNGAKNALRAAKASGIKHILFTSSAMVYGAWKDNPEWLTEASPLRGHPTYYYARDKVALEHLCEAFKRENKDVLFTTLRPCLVVGPNVEHFYSKLILRAPVLPVIDGRNPRVQFIHEGDLARAYKIVLKKRVGGIFNIVGKGVLRWREVIKLSGKIALPVPSFLIYPMMAILWKLRVPFVEAPPGCLDFIRYPLVASGQKAVTKLGFVPRYSSREAAMAFLASKKPR